MSLPIPIDFRILKIGDGGAPEVFTRVCGMLVGNLNQNVESNTQDMRDCDTPGAPAIKRVIVGAHVWTYSGSGVANSEETVALYGHLGKKRNVQIEDRSNNGTATGLLLGTHSGKALIASYNTSSTNGGDSTMEIELTGEGMLAYAGAP